MKTRESTLETAGFVLIALSLGLVQLSLFAATERPVLPCRHRLADRRDTRRRRPRVPRSFCRSAIYAALTLVSAAFSPTPMAGIQSIRASCSCS
jgi:hypothetical protein